MDKNTKLKYFPLTELIQIGNIGFVFEVSQNLKYNLLSPDVLSFFDGVSETGMSTEECAFPPPIPNTNLRFSLFHNIGEDWVICSDGVFRKCTSVECEVKENNQARILIFYIDCSLNNKDIVGVIAKEE